MTINVAVLGGGFSGLTLSYFLKRFSIPGSVNVSIFEAKPTYGGWISRTDIDDYGKKGSIFCFGPKSIRTANYKSPALINIVKDLNINDKFLIADKTAISLTNRYIFHKNQIISASLINILLKKFSVFSAADYGRLIIKDLRPRPLPESDLTVHEFFSRYISENFSDMLMDPIMIGIYARSSKDLSMRYCLNDIWNSMKRTGRILPSLMQKKNERDCVYSIPQVADYLQEHGKIDILSDCQMLGFEGGMQTMITALQDLLNSESYNVKMYKDAKIKSIHFQDKNGLKEPVLGYNGKQVRFDHIFSTLPAYEISSLVGRNNETLKNLLDNCKYSSVVSISLEFDNKDCCDFHYPGFGVLVPTIEEKIAPVIGIMFDSMIFPQFYKNPTTQIFTVLMGGSHFDSYFGEYSNASADLLLKRALEIFRLHLNIHGDPIRSSIRILKDCLPCPGLNHSSYIESINAATKNLPFNICGSFVSGVSLPDIAYYNLEESTTFLQKSRCLNIS